MIYEIKGDILLTNAKSIAHGIAPNEHFDSGLALALREKWPSLAKDYRHYAHLVHPKAGEIWTWASSSGQRIFNLLTQDGEHSHGARPQKATIANVNHCLRRLNHELVKEKISSIAIPALATGVGGLSWKDVRPLLEEHLGALQIPVYIYSAYQAGVKGEEP